MITDMHNDEHYDGDPDGLGFVRGAVRILPFVVVFWGIVIWLAMK